MARKNLSPPPYLADAIYHKPQEPDTSYAKTCVREYELGQPRSCQRGRLLAMPRSILPSFFGCFFCFTRWCWSRTEQPFGKLALLRLFFVREMRPIDTTIRKNTRATLPPVSEKKEGQVFRLFVHTIDRNWTGHRNSTATHSLSSLPVYCMGTVFCHCHDGWRVG